MQHQTCEGTMHARGWCCSWLLCLVVPPLLVVASGCFVVVPQSALVVAAVELGYLCFFSCFCYCFLLWCLFHYCTLLCQSSWTALAWLHLMNWTIQGVTLESGQLAWYMFRPCKLPRARLNQIWWRPRPLIFLGKFQGSPWGSKMMKHAPRDGYIAWWVVSHDAEHLVGSNTNWCEPWSTRMHACKGLRRHRFRWERE